MEKIAIAQAWGTAPAIRPIHSAALPETGEALLAPKTVRDVLAISESKFWEKVKNDPSFPKPACREKRYTRFRLSEVREYIASMTTGRPKGSHVDAEGAVSL